MLGVKCIYRKELMVQKNREGTECTKNIAAGPA